MTPQEKFTLAASLIISHSISTIFDKKIAVTVTSTREPPYSIKKNTQNADFSVVTPEQFNCIKPVPTENLNMIPEGKSDLNTYLTELLRTNNSDQQNNTFWFPTPKNPGNTEDHTPIQTIILKELREMQQKNWTWKMRQNHKWNFSSDFFGQTQCSQKLKNRQSKIF